ncbi:hypothetical protein B9Z19DRAFT_395619 [Tuber borchii]|uniref:Uncharacterized protein n=1 Tax=Tuber borchii TaxID=42251 RepID=A0A2T6ZHA8_TUBBO|nr:hypothetical protein B9Z19DRAFT_395619 [Tuber borchii]
MQHVMKARVLMADEWLDWHCDMGHIYYNRRAAQVKHIKGWSRLDFYILVRLRSGAGLYGHDECPRYDERLHLSKCVRYNKEQPGPDSLFQDKQVGRWKEWWQLHMNLGLGIPRALNDGDKLVTVCGNPFEHTVTMLMNGTLKLVEWKKTREWCYRDRCDGSGCHVPMASLPPIKYYLTTVFPTRYLGCDGTYSSSDSLKRDMTKEQMCYEVTRGGFWENTKLL